MPGKRFAALVKAAGGKAGRSRMAKKAAATRKRKG
jgi:hypothetical protein